MTDEQLRLDAEGERDLHDPANQVGNGYERCEHCHYTRHPCTVYDLATTILELLDREQQRPLHCPTCDGDHP